MNRKSYSHGLSRFPLLGETIGENLRNTSDKFPDREALISADQNYCSTYSEFWQQVTRVAKSLLAIRLQKGDRVGIWSPNRYEWVLMQYAAARTGVILVNINPAYRSSELAYVLGQSGVSVLFSALSFKNSDYKTMIDEAKSSCENLREVIYFDKDWEKFLSESNSVISGQLESVENSMMIL
jgi:fatty-acyl-CoA synthase